MTDLHLHGWIARLPGWLQPYALLARLDRPIGTWLLLLPGWWAIALAAGGLRGMVWHDAKLMGLFGAGAVVMRAAGCTINDLWDRDFDRQVTRTRSRPLAAGTVTPRAAVVFAGLLLLVGALILFQLSLVTIMLGFLSLPLVALYPLAKRFTWWPQAVLGLTFNFGALMGWTAVTGTVGRPALLLYAAGICWTLGYDTIYAHQDIEDDEKLDLKSTARRFGRFSRLCVAGFYAASIGLILLAFLGAKAGWLSGAFLILPAAHLARQLRHWNPDDPASSLAIFRSNRDFGLLVLLATLL